MSDDRSEKDNRPIDRGWAWVVMCGIFLQLFLNIGVSKSFGLYFVQFIQVYNTNASLLSGIIAIQTAMFSLSSLFILNSGTRLLGTRKLIIIGSILIPSGYLLNAFAPNVAFLILSQSVLYGIGCASAMGPGLVVLSSYFDKKRGFANSISTVGGSIGGLVFPKIIQILIEEYGLQGSLMVVAAILFNNLIVAMLLRPLPPMPISGRRNVEKESLLYKTEKPNQVNLTEGGNKRMFLLRHDHTGHHSSCCKICFQDSEENLKQIKEEKETVDPAQLTRQLSGSGVDIYTNGIACSLQSLREENLGDVGKTRSKLCNKETCTKIIDLKLLKNHRLQLILFVAFFSIYSCGMMITYIPPFAKDNNLSDENVALVVMVTGACDIVARFSVAWIADSKRIRRTHILGSTLLITGTVVLFNSFYTNFISLAIFSGVYGLFGTVYFPFVPLLLVDAVGAENLSPALSLLIQVHGISISIMAPILGLIRDLTGSYNVTFYVIGGGMIVAAVALFCDPLCQRLEESRVKNLDKLDNTGLNDQSEDI